METNKLTLSDNNEDKKIITFTVNKIIKDQLRETLIHAEKYHLKKKSDWVNEAIVMLKENTDYKERVSNAEGNSENFVFDKIYMTFAQRCHFSQMRNDVVQAYPAIRGPQAAIVRAAILSRLMKKE